MFSRRHLALAQPLPGAVLAAFSAVIAYGIRYQLIEPEALGAACEKTNPWWCLPRTVFIVFTEWNGFGWLSVVFAAVAAVLLVGGRRPSSLVMWALATGGAGLILYNATFSSVAVVAAILLLAKMAEKPA